MHSLPATKAHNTRDRGRSDVDPPLVNTRDRGRSDVDPPSVNTRDRGRSDVDPPLVERGLLFLGARVEGERSLVAHPPRRPVVPSTQRRKTARTSVEGVGVCGGGGGEGCVGCVGGVGGGEGGGGEPLGGV